MNKKIPFYEGIYYIFITILTVFINGYYFADSTVEYNSFINFLVYLSIILILYNIYFASVNIGRHLKNRNFKIIFLFYSILIILILILKINWLSILITFALFMYIINIDIEKDIKYFFAIELFYYGIVFLSIIFKKLNPDIRITFITRTFILINLLILIFIKKIKGYFLKNISSFIILIIIDIFFPSKYFFNIASTTIGVFLIIFLLIGQFIIISDLMDFIAKKT